MKRREFFTKTGCGAAGIMLAHLGMKADTLSGSPEEQKEKIMKLLAKTGKSKQEIDDMMKKMKESLWLVIHDWILMFLNLILMKQLV